MSFATSSLTKQMLTEYIANLQFGLLALTHKQQKLTMESAQIAEEESRKMTLYWNNIDSEVSIKEALDLEFGEQFIELDKAAAQIQAMEKEIESEKLNLESRLKQAESMNDSNDKLLQQATKEIAIKGE